GPRASLLAWMSGATVRIGYQVAGRSWMYTHRIPRPRALRPRHSVQNQWDLVEPLGVDAGAAARFPATMPIDESVRDGVARRWEAAGGAPANGAVVAHVSAGNRFRRWLAESFAAVVARLADWDCFVVVTSGPSDADAAGQVITAARTRVGQRARD